MNSLPGFSFRTLVRPVGLLAAVWLVPGCVAAVWLQRLFATSPLGIALHAVVLLGTLITVLVPHVIGPLSRAPLVLARVTMALVLGTTQWALFCFYGLCGVGHHAWGGWLTPNLFWAYAGQVPLLAAAAAMSMLELSIIVGAPWVILTALHFILSGPALSAFRESHRVASLTRPSRAERAVWASLPLAAVIVGTSLLLNRPLWITREPLQIARAGGWEGLLGPGETDPFLITNEALAIAQYRLMPRLPRPLRPLVLITVDALRSDQMQIYGAAEANTPFLTSLENAGRLRRIDDAYSVCSYTYCGLLGTLQSKYRSQITLPRWNVADALKVHGYETRFLLSGEHTSYQNMRQKYGSGVDVYLDGEGGSIGTNDDRVMLNALRETRWSATKPTFLFMHLMAVHSLGLRLPAYQRWGPAADQSAVLEGRTERAVDYRNRYLNGILQVDDEIRQIFGILEHAGLLRDALIVITADHGEFLGEFGQFGHEGWPYEPVVRVPLLIYDETDTEYPNRAMTSQVDIAPTFLHAIGASSPMTWVGTPLQQPSDRRALVVESDDVSGVVEQRGPRRYKYLRAAARELLFELTSDPREQHNLASDPSEWGLLSSMRDTYGRLIRRQKSR